jgi:tRNA nucleotidyltransferase/poly(A) polymerase
MLENQRFESKIINFCNSNPVIKSLLEIVGYQKTGKFLVGGMLRDIYLERPVMDIDFIFGANGKFLVQEFSRRWRRRYALLENKEDETYRVILPEFICDFTILSEYSDEQLKKNLWSRDYTMNAMAWNLDEHILVDPTEGFADLSKRIIRVPQGDSLQQDPLRILRGIRFYTTLAPMTIDDSTFNSMKEQAKGLPKIAGERKREELLKIMDGPKPVDGLKLLDESTTSSFLFYEKDIPFEETWNQEFDQLLNQSTQGINCLDWTGIARLFHARVLPVFIRQWPKVSEKYFADFALFMDDNRFSNKECRLFEKIAMDLAIYCQIYFDEGTIADWKLKDLINRHQQAVRIFPPLFLSLAKQLQVTSLITVAEKLRTLIDSGVGFRIHRLINGEDLKTMGIHEGPKIGWILDSVREAQLKDELSTRQGALDLVLRLQDEEFR